VFIELHYPGDIAAGALIGVGSAAFVHYVAQRPLRSIVGAVGAVTDPLLRPPWRLLSLRFPRLRQGPHQR
jgi:membrane-associated phospholipid phosphatase